ncbi:MAG: hypothetical protein A2033_15490 [Bacteroidetes bacterium GWA2_31_9]|nr:MAG: hypothetical protein A2033_15490 [Bacteroidetes bacterium GWA2_31_9]
MKITSELTSSGTLKFSQLAIEKNKKGERIISLGLGEPSFSTPELIIDETIKAMKSGFTKYSHSMGLISLRELIKEKLLKENNIQTDVKNIAITAGAKQAIFFALMATLEPFDEVINITPSYVSYIPQIKLAEPTAIIHNIDLIKKDFSVNIQAIKSLFQKRNIKVIILNFPHNPTGKMLNSDEFLELINILKESNCYIISDEIYERLNFSGEKQLSFGAFDEIANRVITINGFSKTFSMTGWRIGYVHAPSQISDIIFKISQHINTNVTTFIQKGACAAFNLENIYLQKFNSELEEKSKILINIINSNDKLFINRPLGGFFGFLNIAKLKLDSDSFAHLLLNKKNVATTPGVSFGENWNDHIRISLVANKDEFQEGIEKIVELVNEEF